MHNFAADNLEYISRDEDCYEYFFPLKTHSTPTDMYLDAGVINNERIFSRYWTTWCSAIIESMK